MNTITNSLLVCARRCPRQYYLKFILGLRKEREATPLRLGSAFHFGQELRADGDPDFAAHAVAGYGACPQWADPYEWEVEAETVKALLLGHAWRYGNDTLEMLESERAFEMPLVNPRTGRASRKFVLRGKIDGIVRLDGGRLLIREYKTAGCDIAPDSDYWTLLRYDWQISIYVLAARALGFDAEGALYDVTRKPTIRPIQVPTLDDKGLKVVLDKDGARVYNKTGAPRQTGDSANGWYVDAQPETPSAYGARLLSDIYERPDYYYQRREIGRTEDILLAFRKDVWDTARYLLASTRDGVFPRNACLHNCQYCEYKSLCLDGAELTPNDPAPAGYAKVEDLHPELSEA